MIKHHLGIQNVLNKRTAGEYPRDVMANVLNYDTVVSEFELQWRYNAHFGQMPLGKI